MSEKILECMPLYYSEKNYDFFFIMPAEISTMVYSCTLARTFILSVTCWEGEAIKFRGKSEASAHTQKKVCIQKTKRYTFV